MRLEKRVNLSILDAIFNIRKNPIFYMTMHGGTAMNESDPRAMSPQIQRSNRSGILSPDHENVQGGIRMRILIVVQDFREIFAGNPEVIRQVVVTGCKNDFASSERSGAPKSISRLDQESSILARNALYMMVLTDVQLVMLRDFAVIFQRLVSAGLLVRTGEG